MDCSLQSSSIHGISQARILEWIAIPSCRGSSRPRDRTSISCGSCMASRLFTTEPPGKPCKEPLCVLSRSVVCDSLRPRGLEPARLLCLWDSPSKNTGVGCHALLQGIFLTQGSNPFPALQADSLPSEPQGSSLKASNRC